AQRCVHSRTSSPSRYASGIAPRYVACHAVTWTRASAAASSGRTGRISGAAASRDVSVTARTSGQEGLRRVDLDRDLLAVGRGVGGRVARGTADDGLAER